jgi:uncharacterized protein
MATTYVESSALVKRYVAEVGSAWVRRTVARPVHQVLYTAALTEVEVRSALQRLVREGRLDTAQAQRLMQRVTQHFADDALLVAARAEGFPVDNPLQHP